MALEKCQWRRRPRLTASINHADSICFAFESFNRGAWFQSISQRDFTSETAPSHFSRASTNSQTKSIRTVATSVLNKLFVRKYPCDKPCPMSHTPAGFSFDPWKAFAVNPLWSLFSGKSLVECYKLLLFLETHYDAPGWLMFNEISWLYN